MPGERPPAPAPRHNLPTPRTSFVGRERERADLARALAAHHLVTLTGPGGCGKTRLALAVATDLAAACPDGAWLVELAPIAEAALVPAAVAAALGVREAPGADPLAGLLTFLQPRALLLVLDNCEHLLDACADCAARALAAAPGLRILATSREPLGVPGERQRRVASLPVPDPAQLPALDELAGTPAVRLFVERAEAVAPEFRLTAGNAAAVAAICAHLDGIPLALELAAARVRALAPMQILARLDDALRLLVGGSRAGPTRQQTLRATLDWSYALLTPAEQDVFARLATFAGGWTLAAAEAVCAGPDLPPDDVLEPLTRLVDKSLVQVEAGEREARYRLLEPVRQYAAHHLAARQEATATRARHAAHYLALAEEAAPALRGPEQAAWLARLEREQDNLRAALRWAGARGEAATGLRLATALAPFWEARGHLDEGRRWLAAALATPGAGDAAPALRARALAAAGRVAHLRTEYPAATAYHKRSLALYRALGDRRGVAAALGELGYEARMQAQLTRSARLLATSVTLCLEVDDRPGAAFARLHLGITAWAQDDNDRARALIEEALAYYEECGDRRMVAIARAGLGLVAWREHALALAATHFAAALAEHDALGDRWFVVYDLRGLAAVSADQGQPHRAARLLGAAARLEETLGAPGLRVGGITWEPLAETVRARLGDVAFAQAWAAGGALPLDRAVADALSSTSDALASAAAPASAPDALAPPIGRPPDALTRREREVALLLARGCSDRQVADALSISVSTAGVHVHHILEKLALRSRHQVAAWAVARGLLPPADA